MDIHNKNDKQEDPTVIEYYTHVKNVYKFLKFRGNVSIDHNNKQLGKDFTAYNNISFKVFTNKIKNSKRRNFSYFWYKENTLFKNMFGIVNGEGYYCIAFPLSFYGTSVVQERVQNLLKQLQQNGIANRSYWLSFLIYDHIIL
ncbi:hypothetical protein PIROE2DRAFT_21601 [Piromyces sp. E2]|nr:hypothetical protein PIROE2DRAFT_21601 [Piromyces sp. E2]|eukprot:OUM56569.1 hypothetical protein PIROE2DRAFT_21601 [Piromyces sp. E2]